MKLAASGSDTLVSYDSQTVRLAGLLPSALSGVQFIFADTSIFRQGTAGNDTFTGTDFADQFDISAGGSDTVSAGAGNDLIVSKNSSLNNADAINGGTGYDELRLSGKYASTLFLGAGTITGIENIVIVGGSGSVALRLNEALFSTADSPVTFSASALGVAEWLFLDGSGVVSSVNATGGASQDELSGGSGADNLHGGAGTDRLSGNAGNDTLYGDSGGDVLYGGDGDDIFDGGSSFDDTYNYGITDSLWGGAGADTFLSRGFYGHGVYDGGDGTDTLDFSQPDAYTAARRAAEGAGVSVDLAAGLASVYYRQADGFTWVSNYKGFSNGQIQTAKIENLIGTGQADRLVGDAKSNTLQGGAGDDRLDGFVSSAYNPGVTDTLKGGAGDDTFLARGFYGHGVYDGGDGTDTLDFGQPAPSTAARRVAEGAGVDVDLAGGLASAYYRQADGFTWYDSNGQIQTANIENLVGTGQADRLVGDASANTLDGGSGDDRLDGGVSDTYNPGVTDTLKGGAGNDTFLARGFYGHGVYDGGDGTDTLDFSQPDAYTAARRAAEGAGVDVNLSAGLASTYYVKAGNFTWADAAGQIQTANIENLIGTGQSDRLVGDAHGNTLDGGALDAYVNITDTLAGGAGDDTFLARGIYGHGVYDGGDGSDTLDFSQSDAYTAARRAGEGAGVDVDLSAGLASTYYLKASGFTWLDPNGQIQTANIENVVGTGQADRLVGDANANTLQGGGGADSLTGGAGADTFKLNALADSGPSAALRDVIQDFLSAQGDKLDLSALDANETLAGDQPFTVLTQGAGFAGVFASPASLYFDQTEHVLYGNVNADGAADFSVQLVGVSSLGLADLMV